MTAYNSVDGSPATQNRWLLTDKLKEEWGFSGFVISDAAATGGATVLHHTEASTATATKHALEAGLDVIFQSSYEQHRPYLNAFRRGLIAASVIDSAVARVLRAKFELGLFEQPYVNVDSAAMWSGSGAHRELARQAAREAMVLLKNDGQVLPLRPEINSIAVIGVDAEDARYGDYTAPDAQGTSILEAIKAHAGGRILVRYAPGPGRVAREYELVPGSALEWDSLGHAKRGLRGEYFDNNALSGEPRMVRTDERMNFQWTLNSPGRGIPYDWYSVRWAGTIIVPPSGVRQLGVEGNDGWRLWLDDSLVIDNWRERSFGAHLANVSLEPGSRHSLRIEYHESTGNARLELVWNKGQPDDWKASIDSAERITRASDVAVIVAGIEEGEFRDRALLGLPGHQVELIERVAATGKPVVVVLIGGSAITMSRWIGKVNGILDAWYPGEAGGPAVVDVLFGDADPAGRLPITFPMAEGQLPLIYNHKPTGRGDDYVDLTGQPQFPFGFGLSYTSFEYSDLSIVPDSITSGGTAVVRFKVTNSGSRAGDEVSQLYIHDVLASVARPLRSLQGFARVHLEPGHSTYVSLTLGPEHLRMLDAEMHWVVEPGVFRVLVGSSSSDIRLRGMLRVK
jgi:beta-glucosidase